MKTTIKQTTYATVELSYTDMFGDDVSLEITARIGGYVYATSKDSARRFQLCEGLQSTGNTLVWDGEKALADLIRAEYRKMRAIEKRQAA